MLMQGNHSKWIIKAMIRKVVSSAELVGTYHWLQKRFGRLGQFHPKTRVEYVAKLHQDVNAIKPLHEAACVEVGTGWVPIVPIGLYLLGVKSIDTFDLFRHVQPDLTLRSVKQYEECLEELHCRSGVRLEYIRHRYETIKNVRDIGLLFRICGIRYHAPCDLSRSGLPDKSIDLKNG